MTKFLALALSAVMVGCASINSVSLTPIPTQRGNMVSAEVSKTIFLAFSFDNDFVDGLVNQLKQKCPGGFISGILTKDEVISYFLVYTRRVVATGFCSVAVAKNNRPSRSSASDEPGNGQ